MKKTIKSLTFLLMFTMPMALQPMEKKPLKNPITEQEKQNLAFEVEIEKGTKIDKDIKSSITLLFYDKTKVTAKEIKKNPLLGIGIIDFDVYENVF